MERVSLDEVDDRMGPADVKRRVGDAVGAEHCALNYYELAPGDSLAFGYHSHADQEELFYVVAGTVTFETAEGELVVGTDEAVRFGPGESQRGTNEGDERAVVLAVGAPEDAGRTTILRECLECGTRTPAGVELADDGDAIVTICLECGFETGRWTD